MCNDDSIRSATLEDLICTYRLLSRRRRLQWWKVLIAEGLHPENRNPSAIVLRPDNPAVPELDRITLEAWPVADELERRGISPESIKEED